MVMVTCASELLVGQVPSQCPSFRDCRTTGGSPLEKLTETDPASSGLPQSSFTSTPSATGQPADTANDCPRVVRAGRSFAGVHGLVSAARTLALGKLLDPLAVTMTRTLTLCTRPSENCSVTVPL